MTDSSNPGLYFILGFEGVIPDKRFLKLIEKFPPSGIIFFSSNYESPTQIKNLISRLRSITGPKTVFAIDQEPGRVQRLTAGFPRSKKPSEYIQQDSGDEFIDWCRTTAEILSDIGINLNLAPLVDLYPSSLESPVLLDRSFGADASRVGEFAGMLIRQHKNVGILTCAKHYPGLGSAAKDPHEEISVSDEPLERFVEYHWEPFRASVEHGVDSIMTTHILARSLDHVNPATYSSGIIDSLRNDIGFAGPVISDDMIMKGAGEGAGIDQNVIRSLEIGHNLIIISKDIDFQRLALEGVLRRYESDRDFAELLDGHKLILEKFKKKIRL